MTALVTDLAAYGLAFGLPVGKKLGIVIASVVLATGLVGVTSGPAQADSSWDCVINR